MYVVCLKHLLEADRASAWILSLMSKAKSELVAKKFVVRVCSVERTALCKLLYNPHMPSCHPSDRDWGVIHTRLSIRDYWLFSYILCFSFAVGMTGNWIMKSSGSFSISDL